MKCIRIAHTEGHGWKTDTSIQSYLIMFRSTPHSTIGVSPAELLYGRKFRTKLPAT